MKQPQIWPSKSCPYKLLCSFLLQVWGITYHSWLTFVLLLSACIIWLLPQKRAVCLRCMPVVLTYAIALLGMTYIYNLDLNPGVLRTTTPSGYPYSQIGLVKYPYPCLQLAAQVRIESYSKWNLFHIDGFMSKRFSKIDFIAV